MPNCGSRGSWGWDTNVKTAEGNRKGIRSGESARAIDSGQCVPNRVGSTLGLAPFSLATSLLTEGSKGEVFGVLLVRARMDTRDKDRGPRGGAKRHWAVGCNGRSSSESQIKGAASLGADTMPQNTHTSTWLGGERGLPQIDDGAGAPGGVPKVKMAGVIAV